MHQFPKMLSLKNHKPIHTKIRICATSNIRQVTYIDEELSAKWFNVLDK